ncbi:MAG: hypothetical protein COX07_09700 [Bacteroidetes bacterium CG23_combo_of_CG06-09_8_20_14_all_32_9]|nr:MAG: hypothetical protein COX07_09700 [Bacteroidetes bacterium CG23_combo_of_CG06-09_8_20_14_all_32_9]
MVLISVLLGFIGLVVLINGFVNKLPKKINLGTILVCISLFLCVSGFFCVSARSYRKVKAKISYHEKMCRQDMRYKCMPFCKHYGDSLMNKVDSSQVIQ